MGRVRELVLATGFNVKVGVRLSVLYAQQGLPLNIYKNILYNAIRQSLERTVCWNPSETLRKPKKHCGVN